MTYPYTCSQTLHCIRRGAPGAMALLAGLTSLVHAQSLMPMYGSGPYYLGLSMGHAHARAHDADIRSLLLPGVGVGVIDNNRKDNAYKLFGGYQVNPQVALEAGYFNLGRSRFNTTTLPSGSLSGQTRVQGLLLDLVATLPMNDRWAVQARVGAQYARSSSDFSGSGAAASVPTYIKDSGTHLKLGLGMQYALSSNVWLRAEVERYRLNSFAGQRRNIDVASLSLVFPLGPAAHRRMAAMPALPPPSTVAMAPAAPMPPPQAPVVVAAPMPMPMSPVPVPVPVSVLPQQFTLSAETLFGFDAAQIQPQGRRALDTLGREIAEGPYRAIRVEGHTDRLGSSAYNDALSQRRADTVRTYLIDQVKLDGARVTASGHGETQPVTAISDCPDSLGKTRLITCLQADRRVSIEVRGER